jgi:hypothetical protein
MLKCRKKVSPVSAFLPVVSCFSPASVFLHLGSVRYSWSWTSPALPSYAHNTMSSAVQTLTRVKAGTKKNTEDIDIGPLIDTGEHGGPDKMGRNETAPGFDYRMAEGMLVVKNWLSERKGNQGAENWGGDVTKEGEFNCDGNGGDGEGRRFLWERTARVGLLFLGHVGIGQWDGKKGCWAVDSTVWRPPRFGKYWVEKGPQLPVAVARKVEKGNLEF